MYRNKFRLGWSRTGALAHERHLQCAPSSCRAFSLCLPAAVIARGVSARIVCGGADCPSPWLRYTVWSPADNKLSLSRVPPSSLDMLFTFIYMIRFVVVIKTPQCFPSRWQDCPTKHKSGICIFRVSYFWKGWCSCNHVKQDNFVIMLKQISRRFLSLYFCLFQIYS